MPSGHWQNGMMSALWEMGCKEDSDDHQVVGDGAGGQSSGPIRRIRVVESQVRVIERGREAFNTPRITNSTDTLQGYVPRLARHEDFGRIFEGVSSSLAESVYAHDYNKRHQGRRGACRDWHARARFRTRQARG